jgi:hypothetical protein
MDGMMERRRGQGGVYGGACLFVWGGKLNIEKNTKIKYNLALVGHHLIYFTCNNYQNHAGLTEGGWDRMHNRAAILGEHNSIVLGFVNSTKT